MLKLNLDERITLQCASTAATGLADVIERASDDRYLRERDLAGMLRLARSALEHLEALVPEDFEFEYEEEEEDDDF